MSEKAPSSFKIEAAVSALNRARTMIANDGDPAKDDLEQIATDDAMSILGRLLRAATESGFMAAAAAVREAEIEGRKKRYQAREKVLRQEAADLAQILGIRSHNFGDLSFSLNPGQESAIITDEAAVPTEYKTVKTTTVLDKKALLADLKDGLVIDGAELRNPQPYIVIRAK